MNTHARGFTYLFASIVLAGPLSCAAHDFWIQPDAFQIAANPTVPFMLQVGHGSARQRSPISTRRIVRIDAMAPDGSVHDLREQMHLGGPDSDGAATLPTSGTWVLALVTDDRAQSHLPALRYNDYLVAEGLVPALAHRERTRRTQANGSENYGRRAKAIVQVGDHCTDVGTPATNAIGMTLEIVPEKNPCALAPGDTLPVRVLYDGQPLDGALLKLTNLADDAKPIDMRRTDSRGDAAFAIPAAGAWLLNVVWTKPLPDGSETDFETIFSSVSFAIGAATFDR
jgi:uncharacterized GH25 family protein